MARLFKLVSVLQSMRIWVILGVFPVAKGAAGRSSCTCLAACLGSELGGSKVWEWSPAGMPRWFSQRLRTFLSSPALACSGGSLPSEALGAPRCPTAGGSAGRSAALSRSQAKPPGASSHALVSSLRPFPPVWKCLPRLRLLASLSPVDSQAFAHPRYWSFAGCALSPVFR